jgi:hypothetical protein
MQYKAPIRSQTPGPAMPGSVSVQSTGQHKGTQWANPSTSQIGLTLMSIVICVSQQLPLRLMLHTKPWRLISAW